MRDDQRATRPGGVIGTTARKVRRLRHSALFAAALLVVAAAPAAYLTSSGMAALAGVRRGRSRRMPSFLD
jgi:hypothetical protein